ncbi:GtrA family protein [Nakamurella deserti]|uniref:GtrA family protein n=1 Tax=Nakamurella deserti TaxID=2164074 RepID=UPI000DBEA91E|nr:GtrA family protein [Nakamurella deserti]
MSIIDSVRRVLPPKYRQFAKFLVVGGTTWIIDTGLFFFLKHTVLPDKILTAKIIAILVAMIVNYVLNREWSFNDRGGRERHHEAALFFLLNSIGILVNLAPLGISHYLLGFNAENYTPFTETVADFVSGSLIGTVLAMAFRYWAYQKWVFPELVEEGVEPDEAPVLENELTFNIPPHPHADGHITGADHTAPGTPDGPVAVTRPTGGEPRQR